MFTPLEIKNTPYCQRFPWHPSVIYVAEGLNGHKWWMAQTPFPPYRMDPYRDRFELPCIHFSDDGIKWSPVPNNPLDDLTQDDIEAHNYFSDPHLVFADGKLELYYRFTYLKDKQLIDNKTLLLKRTSVDGFHWSEKKAIADLRKQEDIEIWGDQIISQAVVFRGGKYRCYYVDRSSYLTNRCILFTESEDGEDWSRCTRVVLDGDRIDPWHIDVQYYMGQYQMIIYDMEKLLWYESEDGIRFHFVSEVLKPSPNRVSFYTDGLYRACSVVYDAGIRVYFSAKRKNRTYIGLLQTHDRHMFIPVNGMKLIQWLPIIWRPLVKSFLKKA